MPEMTIEQAKDMVGESAAVFASMVSSGDDAVVWFDEVYEQIMQRVIRRELAKGRQ